MTDQDKGFEDLELALAIEGMGFHRHLNPETGAIVIFPKVPVHPTGSAEQRKAEDAWEASAMAMHAQQTPIALAPKPQENVLAERTRILRGD